MPDTFNFSDVFISYSRKDKDFARRIFDRLKAQGREVWADWEDIPSASNWRGEITAGIQSAHSFLFIISPDSVRSKECRVEIDLAIQNGKRFVPVLYREVTEQADRELMHEAINNHNWIYCRDTDEFESAYQKLAAALDTDLGYVQAHTRLLVRAQEWESQKRDPSLLLRGRDLADAESWQTAGLSNEPQPLPLQSEYITASRQAETRRQRTQLIAVSVALVIALALTVLSLVLYRQSESNRVLADDNAATSAANAVIAQNNAELAQNNEATAVALRQHAQSVALAAQAQLELTGLSPERAPLLALAALKEYPYTTDAEHALAQVVQAQRLRRIYNAPSPDDPLVTSSDGTLVVLVDPDGSARLVDTLSGAARFTLKDATIYAISPDSSRAVGLDADGKLTLWDTQDGSVVAALPVLSETNADGLGVGWSPKGTRLWVYDADGNLSLWDNQGQPIGDKMSNPDGKIVGVSQIARFSPDDTHLLFRGTHLNYSYYDLRTGGFIRDLVIKQPADSIFDVIWSPDGSHLIARDADLHYRIMEAATGSILDWLFTDPVTEASWSPDSRYLEVASFSVVDIWDVAAGNMINSRDFTQLVQAPSLAYLDAGWSPDSKTVVFALYDYTDSPDSSIQTRYMWRFTEQNHDLALDTDYSLQWSPDGKTILVSSDYKSFDGYDAQTGQKLFHLGDHTEGAQAVWSPDSSRIVTYSNDRTTRVWDGRTGQAQAVFSSSELPLSARWLGNDSAHIAVIGADESIRVWSVTADALTYPPGGDFDLNVGEPFPIPPVWSPDGTQVVVINQDGSVSLRDVRTGELSLKLSSEVSYQPSSNFPATQQADPALGAALSPDGRRIATVHLGALYYASSTGSDTRYAVLGNPGMPGTVHIWDVSTGKEITKFEGEVSFNAVDWSPDGTRIVVGDGAQSVFIWDVDTGKKMTLTGHQAPIQSVDWSPDGTRIASASLDGTVKIWDASSGALLLTFQGHFPPRDPSLPTPTPDRFPENSGFFAVMTVAWSPDSSRIVSAGWDGSALVWDAKTGEILTRFTHHTDWPNSAAWSPNGKRIVTTSWDKTARVWDAATGEELLTLSDSTTPLRYAVWSPDGHSIATVNDDRIVQVWPAWQTTDDLIAYAQSCCVARDLTPDERVQFGLPATPAQS